MLHARLPLARRLTQWLRSHARIASRVLASFAAAHALLVGAAAAQNVFTFPIDGPQMKTISPGTGSGIVTLDPATGIFTTNCTYTGLLGDLMAAHIHGPALPGEHAPVKFVLDFTGTLSGTVSGTNQAFPEDVQWMLSGLYYVVLHTSIYYGGELRGQIVTPGAVTPYGSGINPANSLSILAGTPSISSTMTLGIDNPTGSQSAPGKGLLFFAVQPDPLFAATGTGILLPGFGMSGSTGELLVSVLAPNPFLAAIGHGWTGPGNPVSVSLNIPGDLNLVGVTLYFQAAVFANARLTLTNGLEFYVGL